MAGYNKYPVVPGQIVGAEPYQPPQPTARHIARTGDARTFERQAAQRSASNAQRNAQQPSSRKLTTNKKKLRRLARQQARSS